MLQLTLPFAARLLACPLLYHSSTTSRALYQLKFSFGCVQFDGLRLFLLLYHLQLNPSRNVFCSMRYFCMIVLFVVGAGRVCRCTHLPSGYKHEPARDHRNIREHEGTRSWWWNHRDAVGRTGWEEVAKSLPQKVFYTISSVSLNFPPRSRQFDPFWGFASNLTHVTACIKLVTWK